MKHNKTKSNTMQKQSKPVPSKPEPLKAESAKKYSKVEILNDPAKYKEFIANITKSQENSKKVYEKISNTMETVNTVIEEGEKTSQNYEEFKEEYQEAFRSIAQSIRASLNNNQNTFQVNTGDPEMRPKPGNPITASEIMAECKNVIFLTGAGLSVASGLPTFRGEGGMWTLRNKTEKIKATEFMTRAFMKNHMDEIWRWDHQFKKLIQANKPNRGHYAIAKLQITAEESKSSTKIHVVTQNIDGYHIQAINDILKEQGKNPIQKKVGDKGYGFSEYVHCIHGDMQYMRCDQACTEDLYPFPENVEDETWIPLCPKCKGKARPHTLLFDESYNENHYKLDTVTQLMEQFDCLVVVGTALETNLASKMVDNAIDKKIPIIEINPNPCIQQGKVCQVICPSEKSLPIICKALEDRIMGIKRPILPQNNSSDEEVEEILAEISINKLEKSKQEKATNASASKTISTKSQVQPSLSVKREKQTDVPIKTTASITGIGKSLTNSKKK